MADKRIPELIRDQAYTIIGVAIGVMATVIYDVLKESLKDGKWIPDHLSQIVFAGAITIIILLVSLAIIVWRYEKSRKKNQT